LRQAGADAGNALEVLELGGWGFGFAHTMMIVLDSGQTRIKMRPSGNWDRRITGVPPVLIAWEPDNCHLCIYNASRTGETPILSGIFHAVE
jgi:hypothetical protein